MQGLVTSTDIRKTLAALSSVDKGLMKEWKAEAIDKVVEPWAMELRAQAPAGTKGAAAARSIQPARAAVPSLYAGRGTWNGWQPFFALEFGMSHIKQHTYIRRSPKGVRHVVRRASGTWAPEHRGQSSYWFWVYWEKNADDLRDRVIDLADDFLRRVL